MFNLVSFNVFAEDSIKVIVNGKMVEFDAEPYIKDGRTMVPVRAIFEELGAEVKWDAENQTVKSTKGVDVLKLEIGSNYMVKNSITYALDVPAALRDDRTYVPLRAIGEAFDCNINWDNATRMVTVESCESPVEITYIKETVTRETASEDVTITVNFVYPQITSGKDFISERSVERINEIAKDFTYDVFDYKDYSFGFINDWGLVMNFFEGYPDITINIVTSMYTSEKYDSVSFVASYNYPNFGEYIATKNINMGSCTEFLDIGVALKNESSIEGSKMYDDIYSEFTRKFEGVRFGRELFDKYPQKVDYFISGDKLTVMLDEKYATGFGIKGENRTLAIEKRY